MAYPNKTENVKNRKYGIKKIEKPSSEGIYLQNIWRQGRQTQSKSQNGKALKGQTQ